MRAADDWYPKNRPPATQIPESCPCRRCRWLICDKDRREYRCARLDYGLATYEENEKPGCPHFETRRKKNDPA